VVRFTFDNTDYISWLKDFAEVVGGEINNGTMVLPPTIGKGFIRALNLPNGLTAIIHNYDLLQSLVLSRKKTNRPLYILNFDHSLEVSNLTLTMGGEKHVPGTTNFSQVYLSTTLFEASWHIHKGTQVNSLRILFDEFWMARYLGIHKTDEVLKRYLSLRSENFSTEPLDIEYRTLLNEVIAEELEHPLPSIFLENRILLMVERFFTRLYTKSLHLKREIQLSGSDVDNLQMVEAKLVEDLTQLPPTIEQLARMAAMSPTKLKKYFKLVYGSGLYEYYQKNRMEKAREMLQTGKYSVKEVGMHLGYTNLSNFSMAFKKAFNILPSEM
jgi:AraC-like DNA-binding protein